MACRVLADGCAWLRRTYDLLWREAMMELLDQLESESPEDPQLAPGKVLAREFPLLALLPS